MPLRIKWHNLCSEKYAKRYLKKFKGKDFEKLRKMEDSTILSVFYVNFLLKHYSQTWRPKFAQDNLKSVEVWLFQMRLKLNLATISDFLYEINIFRIKQNQRTLVSIYVPGVESVCRSLTFVVAWVPPSYLPWHRNILQGTIEWERHREHWVPHPYLPWHRNILQGTIE